MENIIFVADHQAIIAGVVCPLKNNSEVISLKVVSTGMVSDIVK